MKKCRVQWFLAFALVIRLLILYDTAEFYRRTLDVIHAVTVANASSLIDPNFDFECDSGFKAKFQKITLLI